MPYDLVVDEERKKQHDEFMDLLRSGAHLDFERFPLNPETPLGQKGEIL